METTAKQINFDNLFNTKHQIFGRVSKYVMTNEHLNCTDKVTYTLLASYAGNGDIAFPSRNTLTNALGIGEKRLDNSIFRLNIRNYIKTEKQKTTGKYKKNIYKIIRCPKPYEITPEDERTASDYRQIQERGINGYAYGVFVRDVLLDHKLDTVAKAVYLYFCALAGNTNIAYPKIEHTLYHLKISRNTYHKYLIQLVGYGYVRSIKIRDNHGRFNKQAYELVAHPNAGKETSFDYKPAQTIEKPASTREEPVSPCTKNGGTENAKTVPIIEQSCEEPKYIELYENLDISDTDRSAPCAQNEVAQPGASLPSAKNDGYNTNRINTNSFSKTISNSNLSIQGIPNVDRVDNKCSENKSDSIDSQNFKISKINKKVLSQSSQNKTYASVKPNDVLNELLINKNIPLVYSDNPEALNTAVSLLTNEVNFTASSFLKNVILKSLVDLCSNSSMLDRINTHITIFAPGSPYQSVSFDSWFSDFEKSFSAYVSKREFSQIINDSSQRVTRYDGIRNIYAYTKQALIKSLFDFWHVEPIQNDCSSPDSYEYQSYNCQKRSSFDIEEFFAKAAKKSMKY
ncbi:MAG: helix-turn-helix domain-containing protein [Oscillospiraceae bacterium]|nr:helix-turn-helix domain-containing protein [Oscillospiraceae bacterium]